MVKIYFEKGLSIWETYATYKLVGFNSLLEKKDSIYTHTHTQHTYLSCMCSMQKTHKHIVTNTPLWTHIFKLAKIFTINIYLYIFVMKGKDDTSKRMHKIYQNNINESTDSTHWILAACSGTIEHVPLSFLHEDVIHVTINYLLIHIVS